MFLKIYFSRHARRQMKWRGISEAEVKDAVLGPEAVEDSISGRKKRFKAYRQKMAEGYLHRRRG